MPRHSTPPFRTNPSVIARYFFHDCERFLHFTAATPQQRRFKGIPKPEFEQSPLVEAILASGYQWEREVVETLLKGRVVVAPGSGELHTRRLSVAQTIKHLQKEPSGRFLYQPTLSPPCVARHLCVPRGYQGNRAAARALSIMARRHRAGRRDPIYLPIHAPPRSCPQEPYLPECAECPRVFPVRPQ